MCGVVLKGGHLSVQSLLKWCVNWTESQGLRGISMELGVGRDYPTVALTWGRRWWYNLGVLHCTPGKQWYTIDPVVPTFSDAAGTILLCSDEVSACTWRWVLFSWGSTGRFPLAGDHEGLDWSRKLPGSEESLVKHQFCNTDEEGLARGLLGHWCRMTDISEVVGEGTCQHSPGWTVWTIKDHPEVQYFLLEVGQCCSGRAQGVDAVLKHGQHWLVDDDQNPHWRKSCCIISAHLCSYLDTLTSLLYQLVARKWLVAQR